MKRILSLIIALMLVISLFAATSIAFAEEDDGQEESRVTFNDEVFKENVFEHDATIEMSKNFMFGKDDDENVVWFKNYELVHQIFEGIRYIVLEDEDIDEDAEKFSVKYNMNVPEEVLGDDDEQEGEDKVVIPEAPADKEYQPTQQVTLAKAPVLKGYVFTGWEIQFTAEGRADEFDQYQNFPASFVFNMPAAEVTVVAHWEKEAEEDEEKQTVTFYANDIIYVLYTSADTKTNELNDMESWGHCDVTSTFSVTPDDANGNWWAFRFAVGDGEKYVANGKVFDWKDQIIATSYDNVLKEIEEHTKSGDIDQDDVQAKILEHNYTLWCIAQDTTAPEFSLSSTMKEKQEDGLTVGTKYSISKSLTVEDASGYTVNYKVFKKVGTKVEGADSEGWLLIYDSSLDSDERVTEGYEKNISTSGEITPLKSDVTGEYVYKIVYTVEDDYHNKGVNEEDKSLDYVEMFLKVNNPTKGKDLTAIEAWKIVLYVIAGLSAAGIVALLFVKPKQAKATDARYNASAKDAADGNSDNGKQE